MTTIAFDGRYLSIDSRVSCGDTGQSARKWYLVTMPCGTPAFCVGAGTVADIQAAVRAVEAGAPAPPGDYSLVIQEKGGELVEWADGVPMSLSGYPRYANGSGQQAALAAMRMGASATNAVAVAAEVDLYTALPVTTFDCQTFKMTKRKPRLPAE